MRHARLLCVYKPEILLHVHLCFLWVCFQDSDWMRQEAGSTVCKVVLQESLQEKFGHTPISWERGKGKQPNQVLSFKKANSRQPESQRALSLTRPGVKTGDTFQLPLHLNFKPPTVLKSFCIWRLSLQDTSSSRRYFLAIIVPYLVQGESSIFDCSCVVRI